MEDKVGSNPVEVMDSMLDWELVADSRIIDGEARILEELEVSIRNTQKVFTSEEEQQLIVSLLELVVHPQHTEKAIRCLSLYIRFKVSEPVLVAAISDQLYDYFKTPETAELAFSAIKTLIIEMPSIDVIPWNKDSRPVQLALKLVESLAPRVVGGITKSNVSESFEILSMLIRHFGTIMRNHAKLCHMRFLGDCPYFCTGIELGKGAFANVFLGRHTKTGEVVAIKMMDWDRLTNGKDKVRAALENEMKIMRESDHPNIVKLFDSLRDGCYLHLILEYCGGGSLEEYLLKRGPLSEEETLHWLRELSLGLKFLHDKSIVHRDLKPGNLLLSEDTSRGSLKITDFTFARFLEPGDLATSFVGTPLYMAPEIFHDKRYTQKSDLWSVGVLMYQMLTGSLPYRGINFIDLQDNIQNNSISWPSHIKVSADLKDLVQSLLQKNADLRISWTEFFLHPCVRMLGDESSDEEPALGESQLLRSVVVNTDIDSQLKAATAELDAKKIELKGVKEELEMTKERLAHTQEEMEEMATRLMMAEMAQEQEEAKAKEVSAKAAEEKKALEQTIEGLKNQVLLLATARIKESTDEDEVQKLRKENTKLQESVETLMKELEVYKIALQLEAADAGIKETWRKFFSNS